MNFVLLILFIHFFLQYIPLITVINDHSRKIMYMDLHRNSFLILTNMFLESLRMFTELKMSALH